MSCCRYICSLTKTTGQWVVDWFLSSGSCSDTLIIVTFSKRFWSLIIAAYCFKIWKCCMYAFAPMLHVCMCVHPALRCLNLYSVKGNFYGPWIEWWGPYCKLRSVCLSVHLSTNIKFCFIFDLYKVQCSYFICMFFGSCTFRWHKSWPPYDLDPVTLDQPVEMGLDISQRNLVCYYHYQ